MPTPTPHVGHETRVRVQLALGDRARQLNGRAFTGRRRRVLQFKRGSSPARPRWPSALPGLAAAALRAAAPSCAWFACTRATPPSPARRAAPERPLCLCLHGPAGAGSHSPRASARLATARGSQLHDLRQELNVLDVLEVELRAARTTTLAVRRSDGRAAAATEPRVLPSVRGDAVCAADAGQRHGGGTAAWSNTAVMSRFIRSSGTEETERRAAKLARSSRQALPSWTATTAPTCSSPSPRTTRCARAPTSLREAPLFRR